MLPYNISILPGIKEGISGTMVSLDCISIKKNIEKERKEAALEVIKYYTSKEYQKKIFEKRICLTSLIDLLNDEEICKNGFCNISKESQIVREPKFIKERPENYRKKYKQYIYQFLYENKTVDETQKEIIDMTKIYHISLNTENSYVGLYFFIFFSIISFLMLLSLFVLFRDNFNPFFDTLSIDFWIISVLGSLIILWIPFLNYGPIDVIDCHIKLFLLSIGFTFCIYPSLNLLISNFPEENKISTWIFNHKYIFLFLNILIDILLNGITLINQCTIKIIYIEEGENFEVCNYLREYSIIILIVYKLIVTILILFLTYIEWNILKTTVYLKFVVSSLYIDVLSVILSLIFIIIQVKDYILHFVLQAINTSTISIINYSFLFGIRVILGFLNKKNVKLQFINDINKKFIDNETVQSNVKSKSFDDSVTNTANILKTRYIEESDGGGNETCNKNNLYTKIISYHYKVESSKSTISSSNFSSNSHNN